METYFRLHNKIHGDDLSHERGSDVYALTYELDQGSDHSSGCEMNWIRDRIIAVVAE